jgi:hypothetical protein
MLVAADTSIDPHRLVKLCSEHGHRQGPSVSLLVPVSLESRRSFEAPAAGERLLRAALPLLEAAGIRLEDIALVDHPDFVEQFVRSGGFDALLVCPACGSESSPVLPAAARLARLHGLSVDGDGRRIRF